MTKTALITGVTGQDGAYLAEHLLAQGYVVHGIKRRASSFNTERVDHLYDDPHKAGVRFFMHYGDLTDATNLIRIVQETQPDEIYNLAAQSPRAGELRDRRVHGQRRRPGHAAPARGDAHSGARGKDALLPGLHLGDVRPGTGSPQRETTPFYPRSPYGAAKVYGYWIVVNYREAYGLHASNGILFNHESPIRGETFVTRKITRAVARIALGLQDDLYLGNLASLRDWGHARDYVRAMYLMLQQDEPDDYVIATGEQHSVREFCERAFAEAGIGLAFSGEGLDEVGVVDSVDPDLLARARIGGGACAPAVPASAPAGAAAGATRTRDSSATAATTAAESTAAERLTPGRVLVKVDPRYHRPTEVASLVGDAAKARERLGWQPEIGFEQLVHEMVWEDIDQACRDEHARAGGFRVHQYRE